MDNTALPNFFARFNPKWIFLCLGVVVLIELIIGIRTLTEPKVPTRQASGSAVVSSKGRIAIKSAQPVVKKGEMVAVYFEVTSPLPSVGVDIVAHFDTKALQASDSAILKGTIFPQFPVAKIEGNGLIRISGIITPADKGFSGKGVLAVVNFKALTAGITTISLDATLGSTADSNIVSEVSAKDLLEEVENLEVTIE